LFNLPLFVIEFGIFSNSWKYPHSLSRFWKESSLQKIFQARICGA